MEDLNRLRQKVERLEKRLAETEAHARALERTVRDVIADCAKGAFEFAVKQYRWQEAHDAAESGDAK